MAEDRYPPRKYFYEILHTKFRKKFDQIILNAKEARRQEMMNNNLILKVDSKMFQELKNCTIWSDISTSQISKRVTVNRVERRRKNY